MVGQQIKKLRQSLGKTQTEFAETLGIDQSSLSYIENGHIFPSLDLIIHLHKSYQVSYEWLLEENSELHASGGTKAEIPEWVSFTARNICTLMYEERLDDYGLAARCKISVQRVQQLSRGQLCPTAGELMQVLQAFPQYSADWLLLNTGPMKKESRDERMDEILRYNREMIQLIKKAGGNGVKKNQAGKE